MTYRERREARAERLREWAAKREQRAGATLASFEHYRGDHAFNFQPGHIPERARVIRATDRAYESLDKAERMSARADEIERQADHAIYSDDPDAPEALAAKIARLEAERGRLADFNKAVRKAGAVTADALAILDASQRANYADIARVVAWQLGKHGEFPSYASSNLSGNISRLRARLHAIQHPRPTWFHASRRDPGTCYKCDRAEGEHTPHPKVPTVLMCPTVQR